MCLFPRPSEPPKRHMPDQSWLSTKCPFPARPNLPKDTCQKSAGAPPVRTGAKTLAQNRPSTKCPFPRPSEPPKGHLPTVGLRPSVFFPARPNPPEDTCPTKAGFRPSVLFPARPNLPKDTCQKSAVDQASLAHLGSTSHASETASKGRRNRPRLYVFHCF